MSVVCYQGPRLRDGPVFEVLLTKERPGKLPMQPSFGASLSEPRIHERHEAVLYVFKAYCVGGSKCRALPLYAVKLTKVRAILISPRMWLGQYEYCYPWVYGIDFPFLHVPHIL